MSYFFSGTGSPGAGWRLQPRQRRTAPPLADLDWVRSGGLGEGRRKAGWMGRFSRLKKGEKKRNKKGGKKGGK